jgi:hypothetical protein
MRVLLLLVVLALLALAIYLVLQTLSRARDERRPWRVQTRTRADGTLVVSVQRGEEPERVVRELPPALDGPELASELRLAREDAALQAEELNRRMGR